MLNLQITPIHAALLLTLPPTLHAQTVTLKPGDTSLRVEIDGQVFTEYITKDVARPYMYPLIGGAGVNVSREFPMKKGAPGKKMFEDHPHHRSLWFGHSRINEINFWAEYQVFGKQEHAGFSKVEQAGHQDSFNSNGIRDHALWGKRADWICYHGPDPKGCPVGVVIFSHPSNLRSATTWHARDYGLLAVNPFGLHDFDPAQPAGAGDYTIKKGDSLTLRYRFYFAKRTPASEALAGRFEAYAKEK